MLEEKQGRVVLTQFANVRHVWDDSWNRSGREERTELAFNVFDEKFVTGLRA